MPAVIVPPPVFGTPRGIVRVYREHAALSLLTTWPDAACAYITLILAVDGEQARAFAPFVVAWFPTLSIAGIALLLRWCSPVRRTFTSQTS